MQLAVMSLGDLLADPVTGTTMTELERHRSIVNQAVVAEELGFTAVHLGEHHFSDYQLSSPPVVLAAIAERTTNLRLSTAVTLGANLDPVRVAEDYATVDVLSSGRAEVVLGRGNLFVETYENFGQPVDTARALFDENVRLLQRLLTEEDVVWQGQFRSPLTGVTTRPRPVADLPVWIGAASPASAELAADIGAWLMLPTVFGKPEMFVGIADAYRERWEANGRSPADARVGACSHTHVAATQAAAAEWEPYYRNYWDFVGGLLGGRGRWPAFDFDDLTCGPAIVGSPAQVVDRIGQWHEILNMDRHLFMFDLGGISQPALQTTLELFGEQVGPHIATLGQP